MAWTAGSGARQADAGVAPRETFRYAAPVRGDAAIRVLIDALSPDLGAAMARASVTGIARRLGLEGATLTEADLARLFQALEPGLAVFVGRDPAARLLAQVRARLEEERP